MDHFTKYYGLKRQFGFHKILWIKEEVWINIIDIMD